MEWEYFYLSSLMAAAEEIAHSDKTTSQRETCRKYGISTEFMSSDEILEFENLIKSFSKRKENR